MTYDTAVWRPGPRDHRDPTVEFTRRCDASDARFPECRPAVPELARLADLLEARFTAPEPPWEGLREDIDGDFLYLTMRYDEGPDVEAYAASVAPGLGLVVYSPISESIISP